mgnify:CR=1 FL=1
MWHKRDAFPPTTKGVWSDVFDAIYHRQRKHRKKRNELSVLVRRFRVGAESLPDAAVVFNEDKKVDAVLTNRIKSEFLKKNYDITDEIIYKGLGLICYLVEYINIIQLLMTSRFKKTFH